MSATTRISLAPTPAFCIKSSTLTQSTLALPAPVANTPDRVLPPTLTLPANLKVFVNVAWDNHLPPPPDRSEAAIERALTGNVTDPEDYFVPLVVSEPRQDKDKAGKPSVVFDCIFSSSLKSRTLRSPEFKTFLIELALQRIESHWGVQLSRQIGTPNIASKGKLAPRSVLVPTALLEPPSGPAGVQSAGATTTTDAAASAVAAAATPSAGGKPLIEEVSAATASPGTPPAPPKSILKTAIAPSSSQPQQSRGPRVPGLSWSKTEDGRLRIVFSVPSLTRASVRAATLDVEPRRVLFSVPGAGGDGGGGYALDLDLEQADAAIEGLLSDAEGSGARAALGLKRERALDVDGARAEWRVAEGVVVIYA
ncbi:pre-RNA processing PIH1/Nop17-domain-containing protein [Trametes elegans]|nr:pre-RNA processing PIH1/Nop17-domain-containing protein [Trametes elegans]